VLFITGYAGGEDLHARVGASGETCLQKPFSPEALLGAVATLLRGVVTSP
jgi:CheY-like chemotaxis protein